MLIIEKCEELLPDYFGFIRGIVDSQDLSLNISREILQQDKQVKAIGVSLEKKIIAELKKMMQEDKDKYAELFKEFGLSLKFGAYFNFGMNKDKLQVLLMFYSSKKEKLVSLEEYVKEMAEGQDVIYYATGENYEQINALLQIEKAKDKGYEILYLKDDVDEFVLKIIGEYQGKSFKSVQEADLDLATDDEKKELEKKGEEIKDVLGFIKETLNGKVTDVKLSNRLKTYPVCLTAVGDISIEMEKVLSQMPNSNGSVKAEKVLELNAEHKVIDKIKGLYETDKDLLKKYALVLYEQARLLEGLSIEDVGGFVSAMSDIM